MTRTATTSQSRSVRLAAALLVVYVLWGTSYLAIKHIVDEFPPMLFVGLRSLLAGLALYIILRLRKSHLPPLGEWRNAALVGFLLIPVSSGLLALGLRQVPSGAAAVLYATMPVFTCLMMALLREHITRLQWVGSLIGLAGVALLNGNTLPGPHKGGNWLVLASAAAAAAAAVVAFKRPMPTDVLASTCIQVIVGGITSTVIALFIGQRVSHMPSGWGLAAFLYLSLVLSVFGFLSYTYLVDSAGPTLATSYAYVNPPVALALGAIFLNEAIGLTDMLAIGVILGGVILVLYTSVSPRAPLSGALPIPEGSALVSADLSSKAQTPSTCVKGVER